MSISIFAIVQKSTLNTFDNWSAEFHVNAKDLIDIVIDSNLSSLEIRSKLSYHYDFLSLNRTAMLMAIKYSQKTIAAAIGGHANQSNRITIDLVYAYMNSGSIMKDLHNSYKALIISMILIHSIKEHKEDIREYIQKEFNRVSALKDSMENIIAMPFI